MVEGLEAVPGFSGGGYINECKQDSGDNLQHETREGCATENVKPTRGFAWNRMLGSLANRLTHLQAQIEPLADFWDQAHVVPPRFVLAARPGVGISPALIKILRSSILWLYWNNPRSGGPEAREPSW